MISKSKITKISKYLSLVLRHKPGVIGIELDENGWTDVGLLIEKSEEYGMKFDFDTLNHVVSTNTKKRFAFSENFERIRASQGHSIEVDLGYVNREPPKILFHGTGLKSVNSILSTGLEKRNRQYVHLSSDIDTAISVGQRHGQPVVFEVLARKMFDEKFEFFISENNVWMTNGVPSKYLRLKGEQKSNSR